MQKIKINENEHLKHPLVVHKLLADFELEDVWQVPVELQSHHTLKLLMQQFNKSEGELIKKGWASWLFKLRILLGRLFGWDDKVVHDKLIPGTIRERYAKQNELSFDDLPDPGTREFVPVYLLENEFLSEIENKTVQAAVHFSRVTIRENVWGIHMAVYVKPKGIFGRAYMILIKPFRLWIVYPALMKAAQNKWESYLKSSGSVL